MKGVRGVWNSGKHVTIDDSMIKYMVRAITYVQYMPEKSIKHGIKVFDICCALSTILLGFKVYVGQKGNSDNTALGICDDLVKEAGLNSVRRRTLTPITITRRWCYLSTCSTSMDGKLLVISYQRIRSHVLIMIFLPSSCQMDK